MGQSRRIRDVRGMSVYPKQQTFPDPVGTSRLCQEQSFDLLSARACTEFVRAAFRAHVPTPLGSAACRMAANTRSWFGVQRYGPVSTKRAPARRFYTVNEIRPVSTLRAYGSAPPPCRIERRTSGHPGAAINAQRGRVHALHPAAGLVPRRWRQAPDA